ncbi:unnamed protein product [Protopolystoma xenopodis]|uniref:Uncharacterized protein n=1 Tax=Protopolystoma xenopodis TaxID=117903 RepID=A0A3S5CPK9_9PLAT|nr:unnamed protein product [Protopolystoma xenopodis]
MTVFVRGLELASEAGSLSRPDEWSRSSGLIELRGIFTPSRVCACVCVSAHTCVAFATSTRLSITCDLDSTAPLSRPRRLPGRR